VSTFLKERKEEKKGKGEGRELKINT